MDYSPARLLCPWNFPGKDIGVGCHFLLQGIFPTQGSNPGLLHCRWMFNLWATREAPQIVGDLVQNKIQRKETLGNLQPRVRREEPYCFLSPFPSGLFLEGMVSCIKLSSGAFYMDRTNKILSKWCLLHIWLSYSTFFLTLKSDQLLFYRNILCILIHWVIYIQILHSVSF